MRDASSEPLVYNPGVFYFRSALHASRTREEAINIALVICAELEHTREWLHANGLPIPKKFVHPSEARAKGWAQSSG